jgi:hypothetical protein
MTATTSDTASSTGISSKEVVDWTDLGKEMWSYLTGKGAVIDYTVRRHGRRGAARHRRLRAAGDLEAERHAAHHHQRPGRLGCRSALTVGRSR